ncbi:MAG: di-trans,poly-cis-decaprenylcistransferase [Myxococcales bacterium]|nr:di-trans,poly-cis-decaprenylcistransferase [Myxococcales bacterium]
MSHDDTRTDRLRSVPRHVAIIMDGNGRWARARGLERSAGHERGITVADEVIMAAAERGVRHLTLYAFSVFNWSRPRAEIDMLMRMCAEFAERYRERYRASGIRLGVIGDLEELPTPTRRAVEATVEATRDGTRLHVTLALSYGCRSDLVSAVRAIAAHAQAGLLLPEEIDEQALRRFMTTSQMPDPDLVIRTGGEKRLSDFLLFEGANAELYFCDAMWPDFDAARLDEALDVYARRERRFGRTAEQVAAAHD